MPDYNALLRRFSYLTEECGLKIRIKEENSKRVTYNEKTRRLTDERYILDVSPFGEITIYCSGEKSAFYALCDLEIQARGNCLQSGERTDAPQFRTRGFIEGFYGKPWSQKQRIDLLECMAKKRMNTFYYAPKDDPYLREKWNLPYPETELQKLRTLISAANEQYISLFWCVSPGMTIRYASEDDFSALLYKAKQVYNVGIRCFGLFLDDIDEELHEPTDLETYGELVNAQIDLIERFFSALRDIDCNIRLTVCPTLYHGRGDEFYISKLGNGISPEISLFWTGRDICSRDLTSAEAIRFTDHTKHRPLFWDNYPVNDEAMSDEMHLGPLINREPDLWKYAEGLIANCMEYAECSKIPLFTIADYLWSPDTYQPEASLYSGILAVVGEENAHAFSVIADPMRRSCLLDENAALLKNTFTKVGKLLRNGTPAQARNVETAYLQAYAKGLSFLNGENEICRELRSWKEAAEKAYVIIEKLFAFMRSNDPALADEIKNRIDDYRRIPQKYIDPMDLKEVLLGRY